MPLSTIYATKAMHIYDKKNITIIYLDEVDSTNDTARAFLDAGRISGETLIIARFQRRGRGRGKRTWLSTRNMNLTVSYVFFPAFLSPSHQFYLSAIVSLAVYDVISYYANGVTIKWPNDIYVLNDKIAGILIENSIEGNKFTSCIAGIGINVNEKEFDPSLPNPTSLYLATGKMYDTDAVLDILISHLQSRTGLLKESKGDLLMKEYINKLYLLNRYFTYRTPAGRIMAKIVGVDDFGRLNLLDNKGQLHLYMIDEAEPIRE